ncbi:MAG: hypothetical protein ACXVJA_09230 [Acidimicrobiia bacterium]
MNGPRPLSATLARGARLQATRVPDDVLAAARNEQSLHRLQRRIARWQRIRRIR